VYVLDNSARLDDTVERLLEFLRQQGLLAGR